MTAFWQGFLTGAFVAWVLCSIGAGILIGGYAYRIRTGQGGTDERHNTP